MIVTLMVAACRAVSMYVARTMMMVVVVVVNHLLSFSLVYMHALRLSSLIIFPNVEGTNERNDRGKIAAAATTALLL